MLKSRSMRGGIWLWALVVFALTIGMSAQALETVANLEWAKQLGDVNRDAGMAIASLSDGSFLAMGYFENDFGDPGQNVHTVGLRDVFVAKVNAAGTVQWVNMMGSEHCDYAGDISTLADGTHAVVFTYGYAGAACLVGYGGPRFAWLYPFDYYDVGIAKFDADGALLWARRAGSTSYDQGYCIDLAPDGSLYSTGSYGGSSCTLGDDATNDVQLTATGAFIARYTTSGVLDWAKDAVGSKTVAALSDGSCVTTGYYGLIGYDTDGTQLWTAGAVDETVQALCALPSNREFIQAGSKSGTLFVRKCRVESDDSVTDVWTTTVSGASLGTARLDIAPNGDSYLLDRSSDTLYHFECNGHLFFQGGLEAYPYDVCASQTDNTCFVAGMLYYDVTFGQGQTNETSFSHMGSGDIYLARYEAGQRHALCLGAQGLGCVILDPPGGCYGEGTQVTVHAVPYFYDHDEFDHWEGDLAGEPSSLTMTVGGSDLSSTAVFVELPDAPPLPTLSLAGLAGLAGAMAAVAWRRSRKG